MPMWLKRRTAELRSGGDVSPGTAPPRATNSKSVADFARELASSHRYAEALAAIDASLEATPDDAELVAARGTALFEWGRFHEARICLARAADLGMHNSSLFLQLGWTCLWTESAQA